MTAAERRRLVVREHLHLIDFALVLLACASLVLFVVHRTSTLAGAAPAWLTWIDLAISATYALAFAAKWTVAREHGAWFRRHLAFAPGMLPLTVSLVSDPWLLLSQASILVLRAGKALDRLFGAPVMEGLSERYKARLAEEVADPLLLRLATVLEESVTSRDYAAAIGRKLHERRDLVEAAVARGIAASPRLSVVANVGPVRRWVAGTTREVVDAAHAALTGPEMNELIRDAFRDAFTELKAGIAERQWERHGVGFSDVAHGLAEGAGRLVHPRAPGAVAAASVALVPGRADP